MWNLTKRFSNTTKKRWAAKTLLKQQSWWVNSCDEHKYWCTLDRTFHRANQTTLKHFVRPFFSSQIVSYGVWDGGSYKKIEYLFIFVPYLSVLKVREWIYVDVDRPRYTGKKLVSQLHRPPGANFDWFRNFPGTMSMSRSLENWETIQKLHQVVCGNDCIIFFLKSRPIYVNVDSLSHL